MFDLFFLTGAVVVYAYIELPPPYRGWSDGVEGGAIYGWVADRSDPNRKVQVQLFVDGRFIGGQTADRPRPDVGQKFPELDASCGFRFELPPSDGGTHSYSVFAVETTRPGAKPTIHQIGKTLVLKVE